MTIRTLRNSLFCGAAGLAMAAGAAMAQEASAGEDEPQASRVRDVIVVTAQQRAQSSQDVPISLQVLDSEGRLVWTSKTYWSNATVLEEALNIMETGGL